MRSYMDIHAHILPEIDDGSSSWDESMEMLRIAYDEGVHLIIATPHYGLYNQGYNISDAREKLAELNNRAAEISEKINVFLGNELYYVPGIVKDVISGKAATMAGSSYVLIEFSESISYNEVVNAVQEFTRAGYRPIIAHVERYRNLRDKDMSMVRHIKSLGAYLQVNTSNFIHKDRSKLFSGKHKKSSYAIELLENDLVDFVGSDMHNSYSRIPVMKTAVEEISKLIDEEQLNRIFYYNILAIARNEFI